METLLILIFVILISFFKSIEDTLAHHFDTSLFGRWKGNKYIDPKVSWKEKYNYGWFIRLLRGTWFDLWHLVNTLELLSAYFGFWFAFKTDFSIYLFIPMCFMSHWIIFEFWYGFWQIFTPKNK